MCSILHSAPDNGILRIDNLSSKNIQIDRKAILPGKSKLEKIDCTTRIIKINNNTNNLDLEISCKTDKAMNMLYPFVKNNRG